jgi:hypothetical protein
MKFATHLWQKQDISARQNGVSTTPSGMRKGHHPAQGPGDENHLISMA